MPSWPCENDREGSRKAGGGRSEVPDTKDVQLFP